MNKLGLVFVAALFFAGSSDAFAATYISLDGMCDYFSDVKPGKSGGSLAVHNLAYCEGYSSIAVAIGSTYRGAYGVPYLALADNVLDALSGTYTGKQMIYYFAMPLQTGNTWFADSTADGKTFLPQASGTYTVSHTPPSVKGPVSVLAISPIRAEH